jgi:hypothetical protein
MFPFPIFHVVKMASTGIRGLQLVSLLEPLKRRLLVSSIQVHGDRKDIFFRINNPQEPLPWFTKSVAFYFGRYQFGQADLQAMYGLCVVSLQDCLRGL